MDLSLHLYEPFRTSAAMLPQCFGDQRQPHPLVRLATGHGTLSQQDEMAAKMVWIVQQSHQVHAVPGRPVADGLGCGQILTPYIPRAAPVADSRDRVRRTSPSPAPIFRSGSPEPSR